VKRGRESGEVYKSAACSDITVDIYGNVDRTKTKRVEKLGKLEIRKKVKE
jgi:hypothetical protein